MPQLQGADPPTTYGIALFGEKFLQPVSFYKRTVALTRQHSRPGNLLSGSYAMGVAHFLCPQRGRINNLYALVFKGRNEARVMDKRPSVRTGA